MYFVASTASNDGKSYLGTSATNSGIIRLISSNKGSYFEAHRIPGRLNILDFLGCKFQFFLSILNFRVRVKQQLIYARARAEYKMINIELKEKAYILGKFLSFGKLQNHGSAKGA